MSPSRYTITVPSGSSRVRSGLIYPPPEGRLGAGAHSVFPEAPPPTFVRPGGFQSPFRWIRQDETLGGLAMNVQQITFGQTAQPGATRPVAAPEAAVADPAESL